MLTPESIKELKELREFIALKPARFTMRTGLVRVTKASYKDEGLITIPSCRLAGCLAGDAIWMKSEQEVISIASEGGGGWHRVYNRARNIIKLDPPDADRLFYLKTQDWSKSGRHWPARYERAYKAAKTPIARVKVAQKRIDFFIATDGTDNPTGMVKKENKKGSKKAKVR